MTLVGLPDAAVKESTERVRAAIYNSGLTYPHGRLTVNLAPADLRKEGPAYDLPIAVALLILAEQVPSDLAGALFLGELSLDGSVRHVNGILPMAHVAHDAGLQVGLRAPGRRARGRAGRRDRRLPGGRRWAGWPPTSAITTPSNPTAPTCVLTTTRRLTLPTSRISKARSMSSERWRWRRLEVTTL